MKTRIFALLLSVAVAFSGIPATNVSAAPLEVETIVETEEETAETTEATVEESTEEVTAVEETTEEVTTVEETTEEATTVEESTEEVTTLEETTEEVTTVEETTEEVTTVEETTEEVTTVEETTEEATTEVLVEESSLSAKAVGSNGVAYEDVAYLSLGAVNRLSADAQNVYYEMCDEITELKEHGIDVKNAVISISEDGALELLYKIPSQMIFTESTIIAENVELANELAATEEEDLGIEFQELATLMQNEDYFRNQLSSLGKTHYDAAKKTMVKKSSNTFSISGLSYQIGWEEPCTAISALITTYPNSFNWVDWSDEGGFSRVRTYWFSTRKNDYKYTLDRSKNYSASLESKAKAKVKTLTEEAYAYAKKNYPNSPTYGIIKYFNDWICENNYYEYAGVYNGYSDNAPYYYCHSCYGILLKGYGVCESYALAMTRLLDAAGIRNIYIVGDTPGGGHAWNYVEMPDGKWYLLDSTWNDSSNKSTWDDYLLVKDDGRHYAQGVRWGSYNSNGDFVPFTTFKYPSLSTTNYTAGATENITISASKIALKAGQKYQLDIDAASNKTDYFDKYTKTWSSSNTKVAVVDKNGKVTAKGTGSATIKCTVAGKSVSCTVYVYKFTNLMFESSKKTSATLTYANPDNTFNSSDVQTVKINVEQQNKALDASSLVSLAKLDAPKAVSNKTSVATVSSCTLSGNTITLKVAPKAIGTARVTVTFGGRKAILTVKVTQALQRSWFDLSTIKNVEYTGKAFRPVIKLTASAQKMKPRPTFKVAYATNKDVGTATVTITGTGNYGGTITKSFEISKKNIKTATFVKCTASKVYNAASQAAVTAVKIDGKTLKAGTDYDIYYSNSSYKSTTTAPTNVGKYTVTIKGKGNYTGTVSTTKEYEITAAPITKVIVTCKNVKYTGKNVKPEYTVKIGKQVLPTSNYSVSYMQNGKTVSSPKEIGTYTIVIKPKGSNIVTTKTKTSVTRNFRVVK